MFSETNKARPHTAKAKEAVEAGSVIQIAAEKPELKGKYLGLSSTVMNRVEICQHFVCFDFYRRPHQFD